MKIIEITEQEAQDRMEELVDSTETGQVYCIVRPDGSKVMMVPADPSKIQFDDDDLALYTQHDEALLRPRLFLSDTLIATSDAVLSNSMANLTTVSKSLMSGINGTRTCIFSTTPFKLTMPWRTSSTPSGWTLTVCPAMFATLCPKYIRTIV